MLPFVYYIHSALPFHADIYLFYTHYTMCPSVQMFALDKMQFILNISVRSIHYYNLQEGIWRTLQSTLPKPRAHHSIVYLHNNVYVIG